MSDEDLIENTAGVGLFVGRAVPVPRGKQALDAGLGILRPKSGRLFQPHGHLKKYLSVPAERLHDLRLLFGHFAKRLKHDDLALLRRASHWLVSVALHRLGNLMEA